MAAGKSTIGPGVARLTDRRFIDLDGEIERRYGPIPALFARGEQEFRRAEEETLADVLAADPAVIALGGGAVLSAASQERLRARALTVLLDVDFETAWARARASDRPLVGDEETFRRLYEERQPVYRQAADVVAAPDIDGVLLAALGIVVRRHTLDRLADLVPGDGPVGLVADRAVYERHVPGLGPRLVEVHLIPPGEETKSVLHLEVLWEELGLDRAGVVVALGGGVTTDLAGFAAATYLRGLPWVAVPTTLVGQVDAAIGGKTGINLTKGKNLAGAFHFPEAVVVDPDVLATLPEKEWRAGMAEVVKTGLLAGRELWREDVETMVRGCAACKAAVCLSDPFEHGRRAILNLGHTFAHALEAASDYRLGHGEAVALGLLAALRLSGLPTDVVQEVLAPEPVRLDRARAWAALRRDKKARNGHVRLVLLEAPGKPLFPAEIREDDVRAALDSLIAD